MEVMWRVLPLALTTGCIAGGGCPGPAPTPLPGPVAGPMSTLSDRVQSGWDVFRYDVTATQTTILALMDQSQLPNVNMALDYVLGDLSSVMLAPGGGQGGGSFRQPASYDANTGTWINDPYQLDLALKGDPLAWTLKRSGGDFVTGSAAVDGSKPSSVMITLDGAGTPLATGSLAVSYSDLTVDGCNLFNSTVSATYADGTNAPLTFQGGPLCYDSFTKLELDAPYPNLGPRHEQVSIRWANDASGHATATITDSTGATVIHATECWHIDSNTYAAVVDFYLDDVNANPQIGTLGACTVDAPP
jgi:hypothetical protein